MIKNIPHIHEEGIGYLIRTYTGAQFGYWTGAFKESRWGTSIYAAKLYKNREAAEAAIERHNGDFLWEHAEIVKIKFIEENPMIPNKNAEIWFEEAKDKSKEVI